jgi:outer membrane protein assembly factor BamB
VVLGAALALLTGCAWTNTRFDAARTGRNPASGISSGNATALRPAWTVPNAFLSPSPGLVADGVVVTSYAGHANAYDAATGSPLWDGTLGGAAIAGDTLYGTRSDTSDGSGYALVALDLHTGDELWRTTSTAGGAASRASGTVVSADSGSVFVIYSLGGTDSGLDAWDIPARRVRWSEDTAGEPAVAGGVVYTYDQQNNAAPSVNELVARDERSGQDIWSKPVARPCFGDSGPVASGDYLYAAGETRRMSDGSLVRTWPTCPIADLAVDGTTVFALSSGSGGGQVSALDGPTGAVKWSASASTPPTISQDLVLVGSGTAVIAYDEATGHPVSFVTLGGVGATTYPIAAGNLLLVGTDNPGASLKAWRPQSS